MGMLDGKVAIVTGAGRGLGRSHALLMAQEGASVVVNDLGGEWDGTGADPRAASEVAEEITAAGGKAVANFDDVADWEGAQRMINQAIETYGRLDILMCNAGFVRDRTVFNMTEDEWDDVVRVHMKGHFVPTRWATAYWRERFKETGQPVGRPHHLHRLGGGAVRQRRPDQLLRGQGRHRRARHRGGPRDEALRRDVQHDQPPGPHPHDREHLRRRPVDRQGRRVRLQRPRQRRRRGSPTSARTPPGTSPARPSSAEATRCMLMETWHRVGRIRKSKDRWTVAELAEARNELFGDRSTEPPKFG